MPRRNNNNRRRANKLSTVNNPGGTRNAISSAFYTTLRVFTNAPANVTTTRNINIGQIAADLNGGSATRVVRFMSADVEILPMGNNVTTGTPTQLEVQWYIYDANAVPVTATRMMPLNLTQPTRFTIRATGTLSLWHLSNANTNILAFDVRNNSLVDGLTMTVRCKLMVASDNTIQTITL